jgi:hypothetical protein
MDINELFNTNEPLHPELADCVEQRKMFMVLHHPLVVIAPYSDAMSGYANKQFEAKSEHLDKALDSKDYGTYIYLHERPYRLQAYLNIIDELKEEPSEYWNLLHSIWIDSETPSVNHKVWVILFNMNISQKELFMNEEDRAFFDTLPNIVEVYRGYQRVSEKHGLSYTLDREKAEWFANRFGRNGKVATAKVNKSDIFAYSNQRGESEVIITNKIKLKEI